MSKPFARRLAVLLVAAFCCQEVRAKPEAESAQPSAISVALLKDRLSLRAKNVALGRVLKALEAKAGVHFNFHDPLAGRAPVSLSFQDRPLREGIRALLAGHSYFIAEPSGPRGLQVTVLASPPGGEALDPAAPSAAAPGPAETAPPPPASDDAMSATADEAMPVESVEGGSGWTFDAPQPP